MTNLLFVGAVSNRRVTGAPAVGEYNVTIPAGTTTTDLADFPVNIRLDDMPASFWAGVRSDGGNIRAYLSDGVTLIPHDVTTVDTELQQGRMFVKHSITTAVDTTFKIILEDAATEALPVGDSNGRNAVWSDYEVVWVFPSSTNRTGIAYSQVGTVVAPSKWLRVDYHSFIGAPHQGIAVDTTGRVITIDTNYLRRYNQAALSSTLASNLDPIGDSGIVGIDHVGDGCIIGTELFLPLEKYPNSPYNNQHIGVYDANTLAFIRSYDISAYGHEVSSIAYDGTDLWITDYTSPTYIYRYSTVGVLLETVTLSTGQFQMQGVEVVDGRLYIAAGIGTQQYFEYTFDGTYLGVVYTRPTSGQNEGLSYDGADLWVMDGDGDCVRLRRIVDKFDWRKIHYNYLYAYVNPKSYVWTMCTSVYWTEELGDLQQAFLSYGYSTSSSNRSSLAYDDGPDRIALWDSTDSWVYTGSNPGPYSTFRIAAQHNGTSYRKVYFNGAQGAYDAGVANRPLGATGGDFVVNASQRNGTEDGEGYYQYIWLRHQAMSNDWMAADHNNMNNRATFYAITEV